MAGRILPAPTGEYSSNQVLQENQGEKDHKFYEDLHEDFINWLFKIKGF